MGGFYAGTYTGNGAGSRNIPVADEATLNGLIIHNAWSAGPGSRFIWVQAGKGTHYLCSPNELQLDTSLITLNVGSFTVPAVVNVTDGGYYWFGWVDEPGLIASGSYVGNDSRFWNGSSNYPAAGAPTQAIDLGWAPDFVYTYAVGTNHAEPGGEIISGMNQGAILPTFPAPTISGRWNSLYGILREGAAVYATGFEVGGLLNVGNSAGGALTYHYFAWKNHNRTFSKLNHVNYTGDGSASDRVIAGPFQPDIVISVPTGPPNPFIGQGNANISDTARFRDQLESEVIFGGISGWPRGNIESYTATYSATLTAISGSNVTIRPGAPHATNRGEECNLTDAPRRMIYLRGKRVGEIAPTIGAGAARVSFVPCLGPLHLERSTCGECE
jgi:hypothetical protein